MLQQTQVATVLPYYQKWMERFPTVQILAEASEADVLAHWAGLGYYRRARLLHAGARWVVANGFPSDREGWLNVPGVGKYTAGAIASIALGEAVPLVDGNVERVFARITANAAVGSERHRLAWVWAESVLDRSAPGDWNQALMELGATICTPKQPSCLLCPVAESCAALDQGRVDVLPTPNPRPEMREIEMTLGWSADEAGLHLQQASDGEWWAGLWGLPPLETDAEPLTTFKHTVTHHRITFRVVAAPPRGKHHRWDALPGLSAPTMKAIKRLRP